MADVFRSKGLRYGLLMLIGGLLAGLLIIYAYAPLLFLIWLIDRVPWFYRLIVGA